MRYNSFSKGTLEGGTSEACNVSCSIGAGSSNQRRMRNSNEILWLGQGDIVTSYGSDTSLTHIEAASSTSTVKARSQTKGIGTRVACSRDYFKERRLDDIHLSAHCAI